MVTANSPVPAPSLPWHIAQSEVYTFFPKARELGVGLTGFSSFGAGGAVVESAAGLASAGLLGSWVKACSGSNRRAHTKICFMACSRFDRSLKRCLGPDCVQYSHLRGAKVFTIEHRAGSTHLWR